MSCARARKRTQPPVLFAGWVIHLPLSKPLGVYGEALKPKGTKPPPQRQVLKATAIDVEVQFCGKAPTLLHSHKTQRRVQ